MKAGGGIGRAQRLSFAWTVAFWGALLHQSCVFSCTMSLQATRQGLYRRCNKQYWGRLNWGGGLRYHYLILTCGEHNECRQNRCTLKSRLSTTLNFEEVYLSRTCYHKYCVP